MSRSKDAELVRLTQECWQRYWQLDVDFMLGYCDENITWIGAEQDEFIRGLDNLKKNFAELLQHLRTCHLLNQEFFVAQSDRSTCTVIGRYFVTTDERNDYFLQVQQRCTFVWEAKNGKYKILHIHVSNPIGELKIAKGERFVNTVGYMANKYLEDNFRKRFLGEQLSVIDIYGALRLVYLSEIMYVKAQRNDLIIVLTNGQMQVKMSISEFMKTAGEKFLHIHRSYAFNSDFMAKMERYEITMKNGDKLPIPVKKYNELHDIMIKRHNGRKKENEKE